MDDYFDTAIQNMEITGAVLLASDVTGGFRYAKALGKRTLINGDQKPLELNDIVFLASGTKLVTTIAALQCVERSHLDLDGDISSVLPEFGNKDVLTDVDEKSGEPQMHKAIRPITLTQLLTHSSGVVYDMIDPLIQKFYESRGGKPPPAPTVAERMSYPLRFGPGEGWTYGAGLDWAGLAVERVTGQTLDDYFQEHIWRPLGVDASDVTFWPMKHGLRDRMVDYSPDDPQGLGLPAGLGTDVHQGAIAAFGGQGLYGTGPAYLKLLESLLRNDGRVLNKATGGRLMQPQLSPEAHQSLCDIMLGPFGSWFSQSGALDAQRDFGLGGILLVDGDGRMGKNTMQWGGGVNSAWFIDRQTGLCGYVVLTLFPTPDGDKLVEIKETFKKEMYEMHKAWKTGA